MKVASGDLLGLALEGRFDVIVHGCNCHCTMGAGVALAVRRLFPEAYEADLRTEKGARAKLGTISAATVVRGDVELVVVNAYTQFDYRGPGVLADYDAIERAMERVKAAYGGGRIGYPKIGAGLARGDFAEIAARIDRALAGEDHTLVVRPDDRDASR